MRMKHKWLALLLAVSLVVTMIPNTAYATEEGEEAGETNTACTATEGCTLTEGHEGECVIEAAETEEEEEEAEEVTFDSVQAMIDALPDEVTEDNAAEVEAALDAIWEAKNALYQAGGDVDNLNMEKYDAACAALEALSTSSVSEEVTGGSAAIVSLTAGTEGTGSNPWDVSVNVDMSVIAYLEDNGDDTYTLVISGDGAMKDFISFENNYKAADSGWVSYIDSITKIVVEDGVTYIGNYSFGNMSKVTELSLGKDVSSYGNWAFQLMSSLTTITVSNENINFVVGEDSALYSTDKTILYVYPQGNIEENTSFKVPDSVTTIWKAAFKGASNITELDLNAVTTIGDQAFTGTSITTVTVPNTVISMGTTVFSETKLVEAVYDASTDLATQTFLNCTSLEKVTIGENVTGVGSQQFKGCSSLTDIYFNAIKTNAVSEKAPYWFSGTDATNVTIHIGESCTYVPVNFARDFTGLSTVIFESGSNTVEIGDRAFSGCTGLTMIEDEYNRISIIGDEAFLNAGLSGTLKLGSGITEIGSGAFRGTEITSVELAGSDSGVTMTAANRAYGAFSELTTLKTVKLGNVISIDWGAFYNDSSLIAVDLTESPNLEAVGRTDVGSYTFTGLASGSVIYVANTNCASFFAGNDDDYTTDNTVIAVTDGGTFADNVTFSAGTLAEPEKNGYTFVGWYTSPTLEENSYKGKTGVEVETGNTYYDSVSLL